MKLSTKVMISLMVVLLMTVSACTRYAVVTNETDDIVTGDLAGDGTNLSANAEPEIVIEDGDMIAEEPSTEEQETKEEPIVEEPVVNEQETTEEQVAEEETSAEEMDKTSEETVTGDEQETTTEEQVAEEETPGEEMDETSEETVTGDEQKTITEERVAEEEPAQTPITLRYTESDLVDVGSRISVSDPDGDTVQVSFSSPLNTSGEWQTERGDAGTYPVVISVNDGKTTLTRRVNLEILPLNIPPEITNVSDMTVKEGDLIVLSPVVTDRDGDDVRVTYSGWMSTSTYQTNHDDAGVHNVTIRAFDGIDTTSEQIGITVNDVNRPPILLIE